MILIRTLLVLFSLLAGAAGGGRTVAWHPADVPTDLAAVPLLPQELPEVGYQFARGGYLTDADARYLLGERYVADEDAIDAVLDGGSWRQGYASTFVLLSDRAIRTSDPLASVTTTVHELDSADGAIVLEALMTGSPIDGAEELEDIERGATTWRMVTSQDDALVTVARHDRFVVEIVSADRTGTPDADSHAVVVDGTLARLDRVQRGESSGLSQRLVLVEDDRLVPVSVPTESPLAHTWYRVLDGTVVPAAGELETVASTELPPGLEEVVIARQTAETSSQNWVAVSVAVARFGSSPAIADVEELLRDPLDTFAASEHSTPVESPDPGVTVDAISGETRVGGRYSGYRITVVDGDTVSQLTIRSMGSTLIDRGAAEAWAQRQATCATDGDCADVALVSLLATPDPATPGASESRAGVYESPVAPWSLTYDTELWQERDRFAEGGYDYLYLRSERMDATFETIVNHHGDPEQCVLDELDRLRQEEDRAAITVGSDDERERPGGLTTGHGWIIYTIEPLEESRANDEYTIRIDCYTVVEGTTSLVVQVRAPREAWAAVAPQGDALRSQIMIDGAPVGGMTGGPRSETPTPGRDVMINRRPWVGTAA